ncbi:MAG: HAD domain-containing protein [Bulleidia sp.]
MLFPEHMEMFNDMLEKASASLRKNREQKIHKTALFLDFDGVLHVFYMQGTPEYEKAVQRMKRKMDLIDPDCLANLETLVSEFDMDIIISSSWRFNGLDYCRKYLQKSGFRYVNRIVGVTDDLNLDRRIEILKYLLDHPSYTSFLVLDDIRMKEFKGCAPIIDPTKGFNEKALKAAQKILRSLENR